jgi:tetratricopeptide (TPR) repeat protein
MGMKKCMLALLLTAFCVGLWAENLQEWLIPLREAVYEQKLNVDEIKPLYNEAKAAANANESGAVLDLALSRCEYFMGRAFQDDKRKDEAFARFQEGIKLAEKSLAAAPGADAWVMRAENLSQSCAVGTVGYAMTNGLNVERFAKSALALSNRNAAAQIIIAARWVYAPAPFNNLKRGIEMMMDVLNKGDMEKDDRFNVNYAIGYAYVQQKKYADARPWLLKSLEIYPSNKYAAELLAKK